MKREVFQVHEKGYIIEKFVANFDEQGNCLDELGSDIVIVKPPDGLHREIWTGKEWIEGLTQAEIDALNNVPRTLTEEQQRLLDLETAMTQILGGTV